MLSLDGYRPLPEVPPLDLRSSQTLGAHFSTAGAESGDFGPSLLNLFARGISNWFKLISTKFVSASTWTAVPSVVTKLKGPPT